MKGGGLASKFHVKRKSFLFWAELFVWNLTSGPSPLRIGMRMRIILVYPFGFFRFGYRVPSKINNLHYFR